MLQLPEGRDQSWSPPRRGAGEPTRIGGDRPRSPAHRSADRRDVQRHEQRYAPPAPRRLADGPAGRHRPRRHPLHAADRRGRAASTSGRAASVTAAPTCSPASAAARTSTPASTPSAPRPRSRPPRARLAEQGRLRRRRRAAGRRRHLRDVPRRMTAPSSPAPRAGIGAGVVGAPPSRAGVVATSRSISPERTRPAHVAGTSRSQTAHRAWTSARPVGTLDSARRDLHRSGRSAYTPTTQAITQVNLAGFFHDHPARDRHDGSQRAATSSTSPPTSSTIGEAAHAALSAPDEGGLAASRARWPSSSHRAVCA